MYEQCVRVLCTSDKLYAIGGYDGHERLNTVEMFDPECNDWKLVAPMLGKRRYVTYCMATILNAVYTISEHYSNLGYIDILYSIYSHY